MKLSTDAHNRPVSTKRLHETSSKETTDRIIEIPHHHHYDHHSYINNNYLLEVERPVNFALLIDKDLRPTKYVTRTELTASEFLAMNNTQKEKKGRQKASKNKQTQKSIACTTIKWSKHMHLLQSFNSGEKCSDHLKPLPGQCVLPVPKVPGITHLYHH